MNSRLVRLTLAAGGAIATVGAYAVLIEPRWLKRTHTRLHYQMLPPALEGLRIALLTDMHAGRRTPARLLARMVRMTMDAQPHLIAVTGDLVTGDAGNATALPPVLDCLAELHAPYGVYVVPGNHDHRMGIDRWHAAVARHPVLTDLTNRAHMIDVKPDGDSGDVARLCVAGVDDLTEGEPVLDMLPQATQRDFTILLAHQPDQAEHVRRTADDVDLVLSGHTHGGQVRLPGVGAIMNSAQRDDLYEAGVRRRPWTQVYTSRGIGTVHLPVRFMTRPEIAILELTGAPRPRR
ncbi:metallophosphoesterase [soil metagenome]